MNPVTKYVKSDAKKVFGFFGDYEFLSLSYPTPVKYKGKEYPSALNAFHAAKCPDPRDAKKFEEVDPAEADKLSVGIPVYKNWAVLRDDVMREITESKFSDKDLAAQLVDTKGKSLINANHWGDEYWGVDQKGSGLNKLGDILEDIRSSKYPKRSKKKVEKVEETISEEKEKKSITSIFTRKDDE